jgi:predicted CoA-binding protein
MQRRAEEHEEEDVERQSGTSEAGRRRETLHPPKAGDLQSAISAMAGQTRPKRLDVARIGTGSRPKRLAARSASLRFGARVSAWKTGERQSPKPEEAAMNHDHYPESYIREILKSVHTIAVLGASPNDARPSHGVMGFLLGKGYRVIPVNPGHAGREILGQTVYARLADIPEPIDMVDVFRAANRLSSVVDEVLALSPLPSVLWGQFTVRDDAAAARAEAAGIRVVMDRCPVTEYPVLMLKAS